MKKFILYTNLLLVTSAYGQDQFTFEETGLTPKYLTSEIDGLSQSELFERVMTWTEENEKDYKLSVERKTKDEIIQLISIKGNAVNLDERYFHAKYTIRLNFKDGEYQFEPTEIQLKINSKYDMGWKDFDLSTGAEFFKKGKVTRKYRSYVNDITDRLNDLNNLIKARLNEN